jgi:hypothetical protein
MISSKAETTSADSGSEWQKTQYSNLIRYVPSGTYFARLRVNGNLIRKSLKTRYNGALGVLRSIFNVASAGSKKLQMQVAATIKICMVWTVFYNGTT